MKEDGGSVAVAVHKRHKKREYTLEHLSENVPVDAVEHCLSEEERVCPECWGIMDEIGKEVRRRRDKQRGDLLSYPNRHRERIRPVPLFVMAHIHCGGDEPDPAEKCPTVAALEYSR